MAENSLRSDLRVHLNIFSWLEHAPGPLADVCFARTEYAYAVPTYLAHPDYATGRVKFVLILTLILTLIHN